MCASHFVFVLASAVASASTPATNYVVGPGSAEGRLRICADRPIAASSTRLSLRGDTAAMQIVDVTCDESPLALVGSSGWQVPAACRHICWSVLLQDGDSLASEGATLKRESFTLLSELSALPRFADADGDAWLTLQPELNLLGPSVPVADAAGHISLSATAEAPAIVLLEALPVHRVEQEGVCLTYYVDEPTGASRLPDAQRHVAAAAWLRNLFSPRQDFELRVAWVATTAARFAIAGMAGRDVVVANYPREGKSPGGDAMLLYVALHEAVHQLAPHPTAWISESLASYYGLRALQDTFPADPHNEWLADRFRAGAAAFPQGLLTVERAVERGDRSAYGAFYTKGWSFWEKADHLLQKQRGIRLDAVLPQLLAVKGDDTTEHGIEAALSLSAEAWSGLRDAFLD